MRGSGSLPCTLRCRSPGGCGAAGGGVGPGSCAEAAHLGGGRGGGGGGRVAAAPPFHLRLLRRQHAGSRWASCRMCEDSVQSSTRGEPAWCMWRGRASILKACLLRGCPLRCCSAVSPLRSTQAAPDRGSAVRHAQQARRSPVQQRAEQHAALMVHSHQAHLDIGLHVADKGRASAVRAPHSRSR